MSLILMRIHMKISDEDKEFFETHWQQWVERNPPPAKWTGTLREWAEFEMPCIGWWGRLFYEVSMKLPG